MRRSLASSGTGSGTGTRKEVAGKAGGERPGRRRGARMFLKDSLVRRMLTLGLFGLLLYGGLREAVRSGIQGGDEVSTLRSFAPLARDRECAICRAEQQELEMGTEP